MGGWHGQEVGRGKRGKRKNREVRGEEEAGRETGDAHSACWMAPARVRHATAPSSRDYTISPNSAPMDLVLPPTAARFCSVLPPHCLHSPPAPSHPRVSPRSWRQPLAPPALEAPLPGAAALGRAGRRVGSQQKAGSRVRGAEAQGTQQLLLWHKGAEGTSFWRAPQAAGAWGVGWRSGAARGSVQGPGRLHSHLQNWEEEEEQDRQRSGARGRVRQERSGQQRGQSLQREWVLP